MNGTWVGGTYESEAQETQTFFLFFFTRIHLENATCAAPERRVYRHSPNTHARTSMCFHFIALPQSKKKKNNLTWVPLVLINWSKGPSADGGFTLIPRRLIGADKAARTRSSFTDNWVAQLNYFGARRALHRDGLGEVWPGFHLAYLGI